MSDDTQAPALEDLLKEVENEDDLSKVINTLLSPQNVHHLTDLSSDEILAFSTLGTMAEKYKITLLKQWLVENLTLRVSKSRLGRKEFVRITQRMSDQSESHPRGFLDFRRRD